MPPAKIKSASAVVTLRRVRVILETAREQDGQGHNLQETARRKAYAVEINRALDEIRASDRL